MGVFQVRNLTNEKVYIASSVNIPGFINRIKFQLNANVHPGKSLQKDWNELGSENFAFEILEEVFPREDPDYDHKADLEFLENLWLKKELPFGDKGYNEKKKTREERLRMIASNKRF